MKKNMGRKEVFTIPNCMGYFRIAMIPLIVYLYFHASSQKDCWIVAICVGISCLTDFFDGKIARKLDQVTELGKIIDPVADKLTLFALCICLCTRYTLMIPFILLYCIKEGYMAIMGILLLKRNKKKLDGAMWQGKVCTALSMIVLFILVLYYDIPINIANTLLGIVMVWMCITGILYIPVFHKLWRDEE